MDATPHITRARHQWFDRQLQLLSRLDAGGPYGGADDEQSATDEVIPTNYFIDEFRIYMRNFNNAEDLYLPGAYDMIACGHKSIVTESLVGQEAIICLRRGHLVVRIIRKSKKRGLFDLLNYCHGPDPTIIPDVKPCWAAPVCYSMTFNGWDGMMESGRVRVLRDLQWPVGAGRT